MSNMQLLPASACSSKDNSTSCSHEQENSMSKQLSEVTLETENQPEANIRPNLVTTLDIDKKPRTLKRPGLEMIPETEQSEDLTIETQNPSESIVTDTKRISVIRPELSNLEVLVTETMSEISIESSESMKKLESEKHQQKLAPCKCHLSGDGMCRAVISRAACFTLHLVADDGSPYIESIASRHITCRLSSVVGGRTRSVTPRLVSKKGSLYEFTYTPIHSSYNATLSVSIHGEEVSGSSFTVALSAPIALHALDSGPVEIIRALDSPHGIAVLSDRSRIITECETEHFLGMYDHEGVKSFSLGTKGSGPAQFNCPKGIAVDSLDNIFIADSENHRIQKLNKLGDFVDSVGKEGKKQLQFKHPLGVSVHRVSQKVFIADTGNHRIQVLNADFSFSHMFGKKGSSPGQLSSPSDLCTSVSDFVYVADSDNNRIQVFSLDGDCIRHFGQDYLYKPLGIAVDGLDNAVVTSSKTHRVYVVDSVGNIVFVLGKFSDVPKLKRSDSRALCSGSGLREFNTPVGVTIDAGGYIYVIDKMNHCMKMYL